MSNIQPKSSIPQILKSLHDYIPSKTESKLIEIKTWVSIIKSNFEEMIIFEPFRLTDQSVEYITEIIKTQNGIEQKYIHNLNEICQNKKIDSYDQYKYFVETIDIIYSNLAS